jgi:hypothetical protein
MVAVQSKPLTFKVFLAQYGDDGWQQLIVEQMSSVPSCKIRKLFKMFIKILRENT